MFQKEHTHLSGVTTNISNDLRTFVRRSMFHLSPLEAEFLTNIERKLELENLVFVCSGFVPNVDINMLGMPRNHK